MSLPSMDDEGSLHIVMFPWLAIGHLIPFLELSKCLAQKGHRISFISTPRNIERLPKIPPNLSALINLVKLPLPRADNLPDSAEATIDLPVDKVHYLKKAFDGLEGPFASFLEESVPDWIIYDFAPYWLPPLATKLGVPCAFFSLSNATTLAYTGSPSVLMRYSTVDLSKMPQDFNFVPKRVPFDSDIVLRRHEMLRILDGIKENVSAVSDVYRLGSAIQGCDVVIVRSCREFELDLLRYVEEELYQKPVIPVGLLPPSASESRDHDVGRWVEISEWLEKQRPASVVYVAFGSEATLSQEEVTKLALGLELSELPFFWVLRRPPGSSEDDSAMLPAGFENQIKPRGVVCMGWAPQVRILAHPSVGGFLTHCGWNSIIEGLGFGRPLILFPYLAEQGLNARVLERKKIGLEIPRDEQDGSFTRDSVAETLRMVIVSEEGETYRTKAREMREIFGDKDKHDRYVDDFVCYLKDHIRRKKGKLL